MSIVLASDFINVGHVSVLRCRLLSATQSGRVGSVLSFDADGAQTHSKAVTTQLPRGDVPWMISCFTIFTSDIEAGSALSFCCVRSQTPVSSSHAARVKKTSSRKSYSIDLNILFDLNSC